MFYNWDCPLKLKMLRCFLFFFLCWWKKKVAMSPPCWCLRQKTWNRRGMAAASGVNESRGRPAACLPSGISQTVWGHRHSTCYSSRARLQRVRPEGGCTGRHARKMLPGRRAVRFQRGAGQGAGQAQNMAALMSRSNRSCGKSPLMSAVTQRGNELHWWLTWLPLCPEHSASQHQHAPAYGEEGKKKTLTLVSI